MAPRTAILRLFHVDPSAEFEEGGTPEDLKLLIAGSLERGQLQTGEAGMLSGVFELHEQHARQVMNPAPSVVSVDISDDAETASRRSEEHTSELQSHSDLVCRLLLEKKKILTPQPFRIKNRSRRHSR